MANDQKKLSALPTTNSAAGTDRLVILANASGSASARTIALTNLANSLPYASSNTRGTVIVGDNLYINTSSGFLSVNLNKAAPSNSTSVGKTGQIAFDTNYIYVCIAANTWARAAINSWA